MEEKEKLNYRAGDINLKEIEKLPENCKEVYKGDNFILKMGEGRNHAHTLQGDFVLVQDPQGRQHLQILNPSRLTHDDISTKQKAEHDTHEIQVGYFTIDHEEKFNPFTEELEFVRD